MLYDLYVMYQYLQVEDAAEDGVRDVHAVDVVVGVGGVDEGVAHGHRLLLDALWRQLLVLQDDPPLQPLRRRQLRLRLVQRRREQRVAEYLLQCKLVRERRLNLVQQSQPRYPITTVTLYMSQKFWH